MITAMEVAACQHLAVPAEVMQHVVNVESGFNPFAIGVVGGQLVRQPQNLGEAVATVHMLELKGFNFSLGLAQINRANLGKYGLISYEQAFDVCPNLMVGSRILSECYASSGNDWGKSFSCYYSGNFITGYRTGYVQKIYDSFNDSGRKVAVINEAAAAPIALTKAPSPIFTHRPNNAAKPVPDTGSAEYRQAIRSTVIITHLPVDTTSLAAALSTGLNFATAVTSSAAPLSATISANDSVTKREPASKRAPAEVFEPLVRGPGDSPQVASSPMGANHLQAIAGVGPSAAAIDRADLRQGGQDDAFVF